jgi:hypothetical protein
MTSPASGELLNSSGRPDLGALAKRLKHDPKTQTCVGGKPYGVIFNIHQSHSGDEVAIRTLFQ